jgi:hypothetical protein
MISELKTAEEVGAVVRLDAATVHRLARLGRIPSLRLSKKTVRFDLAAVLAAMGAPTKSRPKAIGQ